MMGDEAENRWSVLPGPNWATPLDARTWLIEQRRLLGWSHKDVAKAFSGCATQCDLYNGPGGGTLFDRATENASRALSARASTFRTGLIGFLSSSSTPEYHGKIAQDGNAPIFPSTANCDGSGKKRSIIPGSRANISSDRAGQKGTDHNHREQAAGRPTRSRYSAAVHLYAQPASDLQSGHDRNQNRKRIRRLDRIWLTVRYRAALPAPQIDGRRERLALHLPPGVNSYFPLAVRPQSLSEGEGN